MSLDRAQLRELFNYNPNTGLVTRRKCTANRHIEGELVGTPGGRGYLQVTIYRKKYPLHRVIWCWLYDEWPVEDIDHKNRIRSDNRRSNLRKATRSENNHNSGISRRNSSGYQGVCWDKARGLWVAHIQAHGRQIHLGRYKDPVAASNAYQAAKIIYHPSAQAV